MNSTFSTTKLVLFFLLFNLSLRLAFITINAAEYTDGIIQITVFSQNTSLYPPLYCVVTWLVSLIIPSLELSAKIVSIVASTLLVIPLFLLCRRVFSDAAAIFAALFYSISPIVLRWSIRVMTEPLFALLFLMSAAFLIEAIIRAFKIKDENEESRTAQNFLTLSIVLAVFATLTHYRGILLIPPQLVCGAIIHVRSRKLPVFPLVAMIGWIVPVIWAASRPFVHTTQVSERMGMGTFDTMLNYLNVFESFIAYFPYFLTYPVFLLFLAGLFRRLTSREEKVLLGIFLYLFIALLATQSVFQSFQSRYLLPIIPLVLVYVGRGAERLKEALARVPALFIFLIVIVSIFSYGFALCVVTLQKGVFGDIKQSALFIKNTVPEGTRVYSNEFYREGMTGIKMSFWSGRDIRSFLDFSEEPPAGSIICLHSIGIPPANDILRYLEGHHDIQLIHTFETSIIPLLPDVMENPISHQNPLAWVLRYQRQDFATRVYRLSPE